MYAEYTQPQLTFLALVPWFWPSRPPPPSHLCLHVVLLVSKVGFCLVAPPHLRFMHVHFHSVTQPTYLILYIYHLPIKLKWTNLLLALWTKLAFAVSPPPPSSVYVFRLLFCHATDIFDPVLCTNKTLISVETRWSLELWIEIGSSH